MVVSGRTVTTLEIGHHDVPHLDRTEIDDVVNHLSFNAAQHSHSFNLAGDVFQILASDKYFARALQPEEALGNNRSNINSGRQDSGRDIQRNGQGCESLVGDAAKNRLRQKFGDQEEKRQGENQA